MPQLDGEEEEKEEKLPVPKSVLQQVIQEIPGVDLGIEEEDEESHESPEISKDEPEEEKLKEVYNIENKEPVEEKKVYSREQQFEMELATHNPRQ